MEGCKKVRMTYYNNFHGEVIKGQHVDAVLQSYFPVDYKGVFFDVGAFEPITISNSYHFEQNGWDVYCFEANTNLIPALKEHRKNVYNYAIYDTDKDSITFNAVTTPQCVGSKVAALSSIELDPRYMAKYGSAITNITHITVPQRRLDTIIKDENILVEKIDILQIDVEGGELKVLKGFDLARHQPKIILVEDIFNDTDLDQYIRSFGYVLDQSLDYNKFYLYSPQ